jgi:hypothetical protein|tara:strand:- start:242 stop:733 length:492 start_codon:yes stop_codon:yes gene_type:complete
MSKKILEVSGDATRHISQRIDGSFYSTHEEEDIEEWLSYKDADTNDDSFEEVFGGDWYDDDCWDGLEDCNVGFQESEGADEGYCEFDDEIQEFIDEKPKRERENQIHTLIIESGSLLNRFEVLKESAKEPFESFKKLVDTDDYENLPEIEKKIYLNLKDLISL